MRCRPVYVHASIPQIQLTLFFRNKKLRLGAIQKQGLINTLIIYTGVALGFYYTIIVQPHNLTTEEVGLSRILINFSAFLTPFFLLGASNMCIRFFPVFKNTGQRHHGFWGFVLIFPVVGSIVGGIIIFILRNWIESRYKVESALFVRYFSWTYPMAVVMTLTIAVNAYSNSLIKTVVPSFLNDIWVRIMLILITFAYALKWISLDYFVAGIFFTYLSQLLLLLVYVYRIDKPSFRIDWSFLNKAGKNKMIQYSLLMTLTALSSMSIKFLDSIMIGAYLPLKFVGIYAIGIFIAQFIETPLYSLERIASVKISHSFQDGNMEEVKTIYYRSVRYLFLIGGLLVVGIVSNIFDFLQLLPPDYREAAGVTIIMSIGSIVNMATGVNSPIISNSSSYIWNMYFLMVLIVVSVVLNIILIPHFGIEGAAIATGTSSLIFNVLKFLFINYKFKMQPYDMNSVKTILVIIFALAVGLFLPVPSNVWMAMFLRSAAITIIYAGLTIAFSIVPEYHKPLLRFLSGKK